MKLQHGYFICVEAFLIEGEETKNNNFDKTVNFIDKNIQKYN